METYYVSLVRGLVGYYVKFNSISMELVRDHACKYFGRMWCSVYSEKELERIKSSHNIKIVNDSPIILRDSSDWE